MEDNIHSIISVLQQRELDKSNYSLLSNKFSLCVSTDNVAELRWRDSNKKRDFHTKKIIKKTLEDTHLI